MSVICQAIRVLVCVWRPGACYRSAQVWTALGALFNATIFDLSYLFPEISCDGEESFPTDAENSDDSSDRRIPDDSNDGSDHIN